MRQSHKTFLVWVMLIFAFFVVYQFLNGNRPDDHRVPFSLFMLALYSVYFTLVR